jgi:beta-lactamase superfamily II metal-dependent hydrolase
VDIINAFEIGVAYLPDILEKHLSLFPIYKSVVDKVTEKQLAVNVSDCLDVIVGQDYGIAFLSPTKKSSPNSSYMDFNASAIPTAEQSNALSPIIYLQYQNVKFIFTGDAPESQEKLAYSISVTQSGYYSNMGVSVNLEDVDFLKVSHHGSNDATCSEFVRAIKPKNAVISLSGNNSYGHPSDQVLQRLEQANEKVSIWRTDVHGRVSVKVIDSLVEVITEKG